VLYSITLHSIVLYSITSHSIVLYGITLHSIVLYSITSHSIVLYGITSCGNASEMCELFQQPPLNKERPKWGKPAATPLADPADKSDRARWGLGAQVCIHLLQFYRFVIF